MESDERHQSNRAYPGLGIPWLGVTLDQKVFEYDSLAQAPLVVDAVYRGGPQSTFAAEPLSILLPGIGNQGGFRPANLDRSSLECSYVAVYTSGKELEWPDFLDTKTGLFRYYGDNRQPGSNLHETKRGGNLLLRSMFDKLHTERQTEIPPFFLFESAGRGRDVRFLGLAAPGSQHISSDRDLVAFWRSLNGLRFQNYEAYFTVLDLGEETISREWIDALYKKDPIATKLAPSCWKSFIRHGRDGIHPLKAEPAKKTRSRSEQLPKSKAGADLVRTIYEHYKPNAYGFEACAAELVSLMDGNFADFELTRPWRDGGRDAVGEYRIGPPGHALSVDCALEAKCYGERNRVGVREMSRLISRIRYRQFGIMVTTSVVNDQAYKEVVDDGHPILIISARDIADILISRGITSENIDSWLDGVDSRNVC